MIQVSVLASIHWHFGMYHLWTKMPLVCDRILLIESASQFEMLKYEDDASEN